MQNIYFVMIRISNVLSAPGNIPLLCSLETEIKILCNNNNVQSLNVFDLKYQAVLI